MNNRFKAVLVLMISVCIVLSGCAGGSNSKIVKNSTGTKVQENKGSATSTPVPKNTPTPLPQIDLKTVKPNEAGKIMVVMFHNFVETYKGKSGGEYTTTFNEFRKLLGDLYDKGYRLVNLNDYLKNNISVSAGHIPMVFTFDDGTPGQFNLVDEGGKLVAERNSAVGIMEEFNKSHPDFGLKGTFYVNLGDNTFTGKGTLAERLKYLVDKGFEIGNHTYTHINLKLTKSAEKIQQEIGGNQKRMQELVPGYEMTTFSLPFGQPSKDLQEYVVKGSYERIQYKHNAIMEVGANPAQSPVSKYFKPLSTARVRSTGIRPVQCDLDWWLKNMSKKEQYVSDGNPGTVTVPKEKEENVDKSRLGEKKLVVY